MMTKTAEAGEDLRLAEAGNGDLLMVAGQTLTAYLPAGRIDRRFGEGGSVPIVSTPGTHLRLGGLTVDGQGRPVIFGTLENIGDFAMQASYMGGTIDSSVAAVLRFTSAGAPDQTFGASGVVRTDLGLPYAEQSGKPVATAAVGFVDSHDRPVFAGGRIREVAGCGHGYAARQDEAVVRLTPDGTFDPSFGDGDGIEPVSGITGIADLAPGLGGETFIAASTPTATATACEGEPAKGIVIDLAPDGSVKAGFGSAGSRSLPGVGAAAVAIDHRGRIVVLGAPFPVDPLASVLRLKASGKLDRGFGRAGEAKVELPLPSQLGLLAVDSLNRVVIAGTLGPNEGKSLRTWLTAMRLTAGGQLDRSFGNAGRVATGFGAASQPRARGMLIDQRGGLILAGVNWNSRTEESGYGLVRYREGH